jgi:hypothetical protein
MLLYDYKSGLPVQERREWRGVKNNVCAGNKPAEDSPKCGELMRLTPELREISKWLVEDEYSAKDADTGEILDTVKCTEIIECKKEKYCISFKALSRIYSRTGSIFDSLQNLK